MFFLSDEQDPANAGPVCSYFLSLHAAPKIPMIPVLLSIGMLCLPSEAD